MCHELFWQSSDQTSLCLNFDRSCPKTFPVTCAQATTLVAGGTAPAAPPSGATRRAPPARTEASVPAGAGAPGPVIDHELPESGARGVMNLGATCYLSSVLQVLSHTPAFATLVLNAHSAVDEDSAGGRVLDAFQTFTIQNVFEDSREPMDSSDIFASLGAFAGRPDMFQIGHADDANVALSTLLDALKQGILARTGTMAAVLQTLGGYATVRLGCTMCARQSERRHQDGYYLIPIAGEGEVRLEEVLAASLRGGMDVYCPRCGEDTPHESARQAPTPRVLILSLNRYVIGGGREDRSVRIPLVLDLHDFDPRAAGRYRLTGVVRYHGEHYTADFLHTPSDIWLHADDSRVSRCPGNTPTLAGPQPYILTYERL